MDKCNNEATLNEENIDYKSLNMKNCNEESLIAFGAWRDEEFWK